MVIVGVDPGSQRVGYAVIEASPRKRPEILDLGSWDLLGLSAKNKTLRSPLGDRLEVLFENATQLFLKWNPGLVGLEKAVVFKNAASALILSEARGVIRVAAHRVLDQAGARILEISPTHAKRMTSGFGGSTKIDIKKFLALRFQNSASIFEDEKILMDGFDALALAWATWVARKDFLRRPELRI